MTNIMEVLYEDFTGTTPETEAIKEAETEFKELFDKLKKMDMQLALDIDFVIGMYIRAYEKRGFYGGYEIGKAARI